MRNQAVNLFGKSTGHRAASGAAWQMDGNPNGRLLWLFLLLIVPTVVIAGRLAYLQGVLFVDIVDTTDHKTVVYEPIATTDGRILGSDGRVLARDVVRYDILAHYRWLESPADRTWLTRQAYSRLSRPERRKKSRLEETRAEVTTFRDQMWERLPALLGLEEKEISQSRFRVQKRIEHMVASIKRRRRRRSRDADRSQRESHSQQSNNGWQTAWRTAVDAVTTAPDRGTNGPLVFPEQSQYHELLTGVSQQVAAEIQANPELFPGLRIRISTRRFYPQGPLAAHIVGSRLTIDETELKKRRERFGDNDPLAYRTGDRIGKTGIERSYDQQLRGRPGLRKIVRNESGEVLRTEVVREPQPGRDVVLALELELQQRMELLLDQTLEVNRPATTGVPSATSKSGGCIVAIDVHTGAILAAASAPRFDLNVMIDPEPELWRRLNADPRRPFFPRASRMTLPPGSVFKALSAIAVLESGQIDPDARMHCQGFLDHPTSHRCYRSIAHNDTTLSDAITRSCNVYFFAAARKIGPKPFVDWATRFGFGRPTGVDLPGERGGSLPSPLASNARGARHRWYPGDTLGLAIGQSRLTVTPLQIARMMAAVANDGHLVTPRVVRRIGAVTRVDDSPASTAIQRIPGLTDGTLQRVRDGLRRVVQHPRGTGYKRVRTAGIEIAGKTGTAEVGGGKRDHAWFAGYVPANNPRIAFAVVLENGGSGGQVAGPLAKKLVESLLELGLVNKPRHAPVAN